MGLAAFSERTDLGARAMTGEIENEPIIFTENAVAYALQRQCAAESRVFFKFHHNLKVHENREWYYYCAPDIDVIEIRQDENLVAYELKGARKHHSGLPDYPAFYDAIGQTIAYLDLPWIQENDQRKFAGGAFDQVYIVCAGGSATIEAGDARILGTVPLGAMIALPDGQFVTIKEAPHNPIQDVRAKEHFLQNLNSLDKHTTRSKIYQSIAKAGERWFARIS